MADLQQFRRHKLEQRDRILKACATFFSEAAVLIVVFGTFEQFWSGKHISVQFLFGTSALCLGFFGVGLLFELKR